MHTLAQILSLYLIWIPEMYKRTSWTVAAWDSFLKNKCKSFGVIKQLKVFARPKQWNSILIDFVKKKNLSTSLKEQNWPSPLSFIASYSIVKDQSQVLTNGLSNRIYIVGNFKFWNMLQDLLNQLLGWKTHGIDVVSPHAQLLSRCFHDLQRSSKTIIDIHHWQAGVWFKITLELSSLERIVENLDCIIW